ncbi:MAG: hypothetical protein V3U78_03330 [Thiotrichaceae bacterium]
MLSFLTRTRNVLLRQRNEYLLERSLSSHKSKGLLPSGKIIESYKAAPSFFLYIWAAFPLLMIATFQPGVIFASVFATIVNFVIITHVDTFRTILYLLCGLVLFLLVALYHFNLL